MRLTVAVLMLLAGCRFVETPPTVVCTETHEWGNEGGAYHLPHDGLAARIDNGSNYAIDLQSWAGLGIPLTLSETTGDFTIDVIEGECVGCLGLASIRIGPGNHITRGVVTMNRAALDKYAAGTAEHVMCQELGHLFGLDHQRLADDSCMDDCQGRGGGQAWRDCLSSAEGMTPNPHDGEQLRKIYDHVVPDTGPPPGPKCVGSITLHTFWIEK